MVLTTGPWSSTRQSLRSCSGSSIDNLIKVVQRESLNNYEDQLGFDYTIQNIERQICHA